MTHSTTDEDGTAARADEQNETTDAPLSRRGWGKGMLLGASALGVLLASKPTEALAAPPTDTWKLGGNAGVDGTNFLGPTNSAPLIFKTGGVERMRIAASGNVGIGNTSPSFARMVVDIANGVGVWARHTATTGDAPAIRGETKATVANASAVQGMVTAMNPGSKAAGVRGDVTSASTFFGVGVYGRHAGDGFGMYAESLGTIGTGLYASGGFYGVFASSGNSIGVYGSGGTSGGSFKNLSDDLFGAGVVGIGSQTTTNLAPEEVYAAGGEFSGPNGVIGVASALDGYGVMGIQGDGDYAGYFDGNVNVTGSLSKATGSFKIDHPLDPANKYLYHSFVESPDMMNVYNGNVVLDARGEATVELPLYFGALNRDFRYQLTAVGAPGPNLYIAQKIANNRFRIAGGTAGMEVSWQVTGIRQDAYANAHRIPTEVEKPAHERGTYLAPEEHQQPASKRAGQQTQRQRARPVAPPVPNEIPRPSRPAASSGD